MSRSTTTAMLIAVGTIAGVSKRCQSSTAITSAMPVSSATRIASGPAAAAWAAAGGAPPGADQHTSTAVATATPQMISSTRNSAKSYRPCGVPRPCTMTSIAVMTPSVQA